MVHTTLVAIDENLPNINKTKHPNKKERNVQEGRTPTWVDYNWNMNKSSTQTLQTPPPQCHKEHVNKERGGTLEKKLNLEKLSLSITSHLEIEATYIRYNVIDTLCM